MTSEQEEAQLEGLNEWVQALGLPAGQLSFECTDATTGEQKAVLDLAWPEGLQPGLSQPAAVLLDEGPQLLTFASSAGFRCFTSATAFKAYVLNDVIGQPAEAA